LKADSILSLLNGYVTMLEEKPLVVSPKKKIKDKITESLFEDCDISLSSDLIDVIREEE
jgi:hypothetical protein